MSTANTLLPKAVLKDTSNPPLCKRCKRNKGSVLQYYSFKGNLVSFCNICGHRKGVKGGMRCGRRNPIFMKYYIGSLAEYEAQKLKSREQRDNFKEHIEHKKRRSISPLNRKQKRAKKRKRLEYKGWYHGVYLRSIWWKSFREEIFIRRGKSCSICRNHKEIRVHHLSYKRLGKEKDEDIVIVCDNCHKLCHVKDGKKIPLCGNHLKKHYEDIRNQENEKADSLSKASLHL